MPQLLVTDSSELISSEVVSIFTTSGWQVQWIDNSQRANFIDPAGDTRWNGTDAHG